MKFNSKLWMLAVAMATVGCQDDLVDGGGTGTTTPEDGEGVYLTVNIASPSNMGTKAPGDGGWSAEDGDDFLVGEPGEREVKDINIYLLEATTSTGTSAISSDETGLAAVNADASAKIVGHGFSQTVMENGHNASIHHTANTVKLTVNEVPTSETVYHVLAVTNLGKEVSFSTLGELRDAVGATGENVWSGNAFTGDGVPANTNTFVMSTHQMWDATLSEGSSVTISQANMDENNPAQATVYVERLAARIDMNLTQALAGTGTGNENGAEVNNPVKIEGSDADAKDYVKLTGYQVINRWDSEEYMLKRVSSDVTGTAEAYPSLAENEYTLKYLYDEVYNTTGHKYNYVIDPFTVGETTPKTSANLTALASKYESHYDGNLNDAVSTAFTALTGVSTTEGTFTPIMYTKENTLDLDNQIMGLATGIIFEGEYTPNKVSEFDASGTTAAVKAEDYTKGDDFYVVNDFTQSDASRFLCNDLTTVGALSFSKIAGDDTKTYTSALMKALFDANTDAWTGVTLENLTEAVNAMVGGTINIAYKEYLQGLISPEAGEAPESIDDITLSEAKWSAFLTEKGIKDPATTTGEGDAWTTDSETLYNTWNVSYYKGGVCYLPYFIRHEDNGVPSQMGPMEYCIVRNNVYQVAVTGVNALGYPLPFITPGDTPVEEENVFLQVQIWVKDWTLRTNGGIIL